MLSTLKAVSAAAIGLSAVGEAHSWVHCSDYRGDTRYYDESECYGHPRPDNGRVPAMTPFGQDIGYNEQPGHIANGVHECQVANTDYLSSYPMAQYRQGSVITLAWPSKNHVAAPCTNAYIPDTSLELFVAPRESHPTTYTQVRASFSDNPHVKGDMDFLGFQNCPAFCENMDKSLCTGTFTVPTDLADGYYTFQWRWVFNQDTDPYVTCFEAYVGQDVRPVTRAPTATPAPTVEGQPAPTPMPVDITDDSNCVAQYGQCAGGQVAPTCCQSGLTCFKQSMYYSQCLSACPQEGGWECAADSPTAAVTPAPTVMAPTVAPAPVADPTPAPVVLQTCHAGYGAYGQLKKAGGQALEQATLQSGCACAKFCTIFAADAVQFKYDETNGKCTCYSVAGKLKSKDGATVIAGDVPLSGFVAQFTI